MRILGSRAPQITGPLLQEDSKLSRRSQRERADGGRAASCRQKSNEESSVFSGIDTEGVLSPPPLPK